MSTRNFSDFYRYDYYYYFNYNFHNISDDDYYDYSEDYESDGAYSHPQYRSIIFAVEIALGLILHALTIVVVCTGNRIDKSVYIHLLNIAVAGILYCSVIIFEDKVIPLHSIIHSNALCKFLTFLFSSLAYAPHIWRLVISIDRFILYRLHPITYRRTQWQNMTVAVIGWVATFLVCMYYIFATRLTTYHSFDGELRGYCSTDHFSLSWAISLIILVPTAIMIVMYCLTCVKLWRTASSTDLDNRQASFLAEAKQTTKMLAIETGILLLLTLPVDVLVIMLNSPFALHLLRTDANIHTILYALHLVQLGSCFSTPVVYYVSNPAVKADTHMLFTRCCTRYPSRCSTCITENSDNDEYHLMDADSV